MSISNSFCALLAALFLISSSYSPVTLAQVVGGEDADEVARYVFSTAGLKKYHAANANLARLGDALSGDCEDDDDDTSLDGMVSQIEAVPGAADAIESAGMPVREYAVFSFAMIQSAFAAWSLQQPGGTLPPGVSKANVDFYQAHAAEFEAAANLAKGDDCDDSGSQEDDGNYE